MNAKTAGVVVLAGVVAWAGLIWLAMQMFATNPPTAAFDLELLLKAGRDVAAGRSPYDPAIVAGAAPVAERLFYSYPPIVAQLFAPFASVPSSVMFVGWTAAAVASFVVVTTALARRLATGLEPTSLAITTVAIVPLLFPFAIGLLFGNLDVFFPALYGLILLGLVQSADGHAGLVAGAATAIASIAKLHPASLGLWLLVRAAVDRAVRRPLLAAVAVGFAVLAVSVALNPGLWVDYVAVVRAGSGADLVDPRNAGPAAQIAGIVGGAGSSAEALARVLQVPVTVIALIATVAVAWRLRDPVESLAWAAAASLITLPVTWYHYPSALIPFGAAALFRSVSQTRTGAATTRALVMAAAIVAAIAIAFLPLLYVAVGLVLAAVRSSASLGDEVTAPRPG